MIAKPVYLTPEGKKKLEEELNYLIKVRRVEVASAIQSAKEEGDISENSAYDEAKDAQAFLEGRILTLEAQLKEAILIKPNTNTNEVGLGSTVTVIETGEEDEEIYTIVGSAESNPTKGTISNESPIGRALLNKKIGDVVVAQTPSGEISFKIVKIK